MQRMPFNDGWTVTRLDTGTDAPAAGGATPVTLPHDAMLHTRRAAGNPSGAGQAYFEGGTWRYERTLEAPAEWEGRHVLVEFEGVMHDARVYVGGWLVAEHAYGYTPFAVCLDGLVAPGEPCVIAVECSNARQPDSRWYAGAGIYRPVWLHVGPAASLEPGCVHVATLSAEPARVRVEVEAPEVVGAFVRVEVLDGTRLVTSFDGPRGSGPLSCELDLPGVLPWSADEPHLLRCRATLAHRAGTGSLEELDAEETAFGVRTIAWGPDGLLVNGREVLLRGGCVHHDLGILGAATHDEGEWRRVRRMREAGFNAIRSAHNPASRALLEACDALGMYVMDEAWDMWFEHKNVHDYASVWPKRRLDDLAAMVARDHNHPSVIMYSIGNEVSEPATPEGAAAARELARHLRSLDPTRPVTCGINWAILTGSSLGMRTYAEGGGRDLESDEAQRKMGSLAFNVLTNAIGRGMSLSANLPVSDRATAPAFEPLDIAGYNYASYRYGIDAKVHPERLIVGTETFHSDIWHNWRQVRRLPGVVGDFVWSAWDYLGETGCGAWAYTKDGKGFEKPYPWLLACQGAFDILGNPDGQLFGEQVAWGVTRRTDEPRKRDEKGRTGDATRMGADWAPIDPRIAVRPANHPGIRVAKSAWRWTDSLPSWSWRGCEGNRCVVEVFSAAPVVRLALNGRTISYKRPRRGVARWSVRWQPGELVATALTSRGEELATARLFSAGPASVRLEEEPSTLPKPGATGPRIAFVEVTVADEAGCVEMNDDRRLRARVEGGELLAFGSARPRTEERFDTGEHTTYHGRAQAVVRVPAGGVATLTVREDDGTETSLELRG